MISPVFIIAANDIIEDKSTNLVTVVSIVERLNGFAIGTPIPFENAMMGAGSKCLSVWRFSDDEVGDFEHQFIIDNLGTNIEGPLMPFNKDNDGFALKRFMLGFGFPPIMESGWLYIRSKMRRVGNNEWMEQSYPIQITHLPLEITHQIPTADERSI